MVTLLNDAQMTREYALRTDDKTLKKKITQIKEKMEYSFIDARLLKARLEIFNEVLRERKERGVGVHISNYSNYSEEVNRTLKQEAKTLFHNIHKIINS